MQEPAARGLVTRGLAARVRVRRAAFDVTVDLDVAPGEVVCLLGPNGAGKSTVLGALAGLVVDDRSRVTLDGRELDAAGRHLPPQDRGVGVAFQDHRLFPHLSALENVAFGPRARGEARDDARSAAADALAALGVDHLADRRPGALSGGQAQRVALARALVGHPRLLLLDEPLASLDAEARAAARAALGDVLRDGDRAVVLVSHDPVDAVALADRVVVVEEGAVVQVGRPVEVLADPWTPYVASLTGATWLRPERVTTETTPAAGAGAGAGAAADPAPAPPRAPEATAAASLPAPEATAPAPLPASGTTAAASDGDTPQAVAVLYGGVTVAVGRRATSGPSRLVVPADAVRVRPVDDGAVDPAAPLAEVLRTEGRPTRLAVTLRLERGGHVLGAEVPWTDVAATRLRPGDRVGVAVDGARVVAR